MKKMKCDLCDVELAGETFNDWFKASHIHYAANHADIMEEMMESGTKEDGARWMADAMKRWEAIPSGAKPKAKTIAKPTAKPKSKGKAKSKTKTKPRKKVAAKSKSKVKPKARAKRT